MVLDELLSRSCASIQSRIRREILQEDLDFFLVALCFFFSMSPMDEQHPKVVKSNPAFRSLIE